MTWSQAVSRRDDSHPLEVGEALLLWQRRGLCGVQPAVRGEDAHAQPGEVPRGQADCACLQRRRDQGRRNCQGQIRGREAEAAIHGLVRTCSVLGQGFNQLHPPSQARRVQSRGREEEAAIHGLVRTCSVLGQGFNQLHPPSQARRGRSLESHCGKASQHREAPHSDVAHSAGWIEDGTRRKSDPLPHQG